MAMRKEFSGGDSYGSLYRKNRRLARELGKTESVFNAINAAIFVVDKFGMIDFANAYAKRMFSIPDAPESVFKYIPDLEEAVSTVSETSVAARREIEISYPEKRTLSARVMNFDDDDADAEKFAILVDDITQEKISEREQIESEKISSVLNLASGVAHELGNPLNSVAIHLQVARRKLSKDKPISDEDRQSLLESVGICLSEVKRLDTIIENFLKALRPIRPNATECDAIKPLAETLGLLEKELSDIGIKVSVSADALPKVFADENLLKQMYFNILRNAMEAMDGGGTITITASSNDEFVKISFADTGCGMDESAIANLFQPYFTTKPNGHGLGMMIIQGIVRAHNGKIDVDSKRGKGTTISVSIPRFERIVRRLA